MTEETSAKKRRCEKMARVVILYWCNNKWRLPRGMVFSGGRARALGTHRVLHVAISNAIDLFSLELRCIWRMTVYEQKKWSRDDDV